MTHIYFVRHAEPNFNNHDDYSRELSDKGMADRKLVTAFLTHKSIDAVLSSPFKRAVGSHGTALSMIINYYRPTFSFAEFEKIRPLMPWIVHIEFGGETCIEIEGHDLFQKTKTYF